MTENQKIRRDYITTSPMFKVEKVFNVGENNYVVYRKEGEADCYISGDDFGWMLDLQLQSDDTIKHNGRIELQPAEKENIMEYIPYD